ncbi:acid phosphatase [Methylocystis sp. JAN1]|uniref:acid phosphatase n=1 Tax=Methylocystis sp. JAN1 TaxID=3397211 RepID=UPI003FA3151A
MIFRKSAFSAAAFAAVTAAAGAKAGSIHEYGHIVVIYQENHSFDNLYGLWGSVNGKPVNGLPYADAPHTTQMRADGTTAYSCLLQNDVNLTSPTPLAPTCTDNTGATSFTSAFANKPFRIDDYIKAADATCAPYGGSSDVLKGSAGSLPGGCTRDLVHRFYNEQFQINGGRQNRYTTGSDAAGLSMGYYDTTQLPLYQYLHKNRAPNYVIADNFFQAAFGGSFLNHQWLIAARTPVFANAAKDGSSNDLHSVVDANGMPTSTPLYVPAASGLRDKSLTAYCADDPLKPAAIAAAPAGVVCGDYAVNTTQPWTWPYAPGTADAVRLPPLTYPTIGDRLSAKGVDWAWYSGGWDNAEGNRNGLGWTNGAGANCADPHANQQTVAGALRCPDKLFQYHHQAFNYFAAYAPGAAARVDHLRDEADFIDAAKRGRLRAVSFVKPLGSENEHPGYTGEAGGSSHLVDLVKAVVEGPNGRDTLIVITYDEFGGAWDHVSPPSAANGKGAYDAWGPGTRIPAILISGKLQRSGVDHTAYDTTSILRLIEERFRVAPLAPRDAAVNSLKNALKDDRDDEHGDQDR